MSTSEVGFLSFSFPRLRPRARKPLACSHSASSGRDRIWTNEQLASRAHALDLHAKGQAHDPGHRQEGGGQGNHKRVKTVGLTGWLCRTGGEQLPSRHSCKGTKKDQMTQCRLLIQQCHFQEFISQTYPPPDKIGCVPSSSACKETPPHPR